MSPDFYGSYELDAKWDLTSKQKEHASFRNISMYIHIFANDMDFGSTWLSFWFRDVPSTQVISGSDGVCHEPHSFSL